MSVWSKKKTKHPEVWKPGSSVLSSGFILLLLLFIRGTNCFPFSCDGRSDGTYPDTSSCQYFYICEQGSPMVNSTCPEGMFYHEGQSNCVPWSFAKDVCFENYSRRSFSCVDKRDGPHAHETNCIFQFTCLNESLVDFHRCQADLYSNEVTNKCEPYEGGVVTQCSRDHIRLRTTPRFDCSDKVNVFNPDPESCITYHMCDQGQLTRSLNCSDGFYFHTESEQCVPNNLLSGECNQAGERLTASADGIKTDPNLTTAATISESTTETPTTTTTTNTPTSSINTPFNCTGRPDDSYYDKPNCSLFHICLGGRHYSTESCPLGMIYHKESGCTVAELVSLTECVDGVRTNFECSDKEDDYHPDQTTCQVYYLCTQGKLVEVLKCEREQMFHAGVKTCVPPEFTSGQCNGTVRIAYAETQTSSTPELTKPSPTSTSNPSGIAMNPNTTSTTSTESSNTTNATNATNTTITTLETTKMPTTQTKTTVTTTTTTTPINQDLFNCSGKEDEFYPDTSNCSFSYLCYGGLLQEVHQCRVGYQFSARRVSCVPEELALDECQNGTRLSDVTPPQMTSSAGAASTTPSASSTVAAPSLQPTVTASLQPTSTTSLKPTVTTPTTSSSSTTTTTTTTTTTSEPSTIDPPINCSVTDELVQDEHNCSSFHACEQGIYKASFDCPGGFYFSQSQMVCGPAEEVANQCVGDIRVPGADDLNCTGLYNATFMAHPTNCTFYYMCYEESVSMVFMCLGNTMYESLTAGCMPYSHVQEQCTEDGRRLMDFSLVEPSTTVVPSTTPPSSTATTISVSSSNVTTDGTATTLSTQTSLPGNASSRVVSNATRPTEPPSYSTTISYAETSSTTTSATSSKTTSASSSTTTSATTSTTTSARSEAVNESVSETVTPTMTTTTATTTTRRASTAITPTTIPLSSTIIATTTSTNIPSSKEPRTTKKTTKKRRKPSSKKTTPTETSQPIETTTTENVIKDAQVTRIIYLTNDGSFLARSFNWGAVVMLSAVLWVLML